MQRMHGYTTIYRQKEGGRMRQPQTTTMQQSAEERHDETTTTMQQSTDKPRKNHVMAVETATVGKSESTNNYHEIHCSYTSQNKKKPQQSTIIRRGSLSGIQQHGRMIWKTDTTINCPEKMLT